MDSKVGLQYFKRIYHRGLDSVQEVINSPSIPEPPQSNLNTAAKVIPLYLKSCHFFAQCCSNFTQNKSKTFIMASGPFHHLLVPSPWHYLYSWTHSASALQATLLTCLACFYLRAFSSSWNILIQTFMWLDLLQVFVHWQSMKSTLIILNCTPSIPTPLPCLFPLYRFTILDNLHVKYKINLFFTFYC